MVMSEVADDPDGTRNPTPSFPANFGLANDAGVFAWRFKSESGALLPQLSRYKAGFWAQQVRSELLFVDWRMPRP